MKIGLHIGVRGAGHRIVRAALEENERPLAQIGWVAARREVSGRDISMAQFVERVGAWLDRTEGAGMANALITAPHLTEQTLVLGESELVANALRAHGQVHGVAAVRRMDDHVAAGYIEQLRAGRTTGLRRMDLTGGGNRYNFFARVRKWRAALGNDLRIVLCPADGADSLFARTILEALGVHDLVGFRFREGSLAPALSIEATEALRHFNAAVLRGDVGRAGIKRARRAAIALLQAHSQGCAPFRLPADAAGGILRRYESLAHELADGMSSSDAAAFLSQDVQSPAPADPALVDHLVAELATELGTGLARVLRRVRPGRGCRTMKRLRRTASSARAALGDGNAADYRRLTARLAKVLSAVPDFRIGRTLGPSGSPIPTRIAQYWEPWPPPDQLQPWMASWTDIGMRGGEHVVASFEAGLATLAQAAGARGVEAFTKAPHPAARADLFRYAELILRGGWYVDAEHEALLPIPDILTWPVEHVFVRRPGGGLVPNGFFGSVAGSRLLQDVLESACSNVLDGNELTILSMTGPELFTRHVDAYTARSDASYVILPTTAVFGGLSQQVHNEADYKVSHWRDHSLKSGPKSAHQP